MIPTYTPEEDERLSTPRASGDDPMRTIKVSEVIMYSPRKRG